MSEMEFNNAKLNKIGRKLPYSVPENYFEQLPSRIQSLCQPQAEEELKPHWIYAFKSQLAFAAGFTFFVFVAYLGYYLAQPTQKANRLSKTDYVEIVSKHISEFDELQLMDAIEGKKKQDTILQVYKDEMIQYLLDQNIDYTALREHIKDIKP
jgi:hypothetical protein